MQRGLIQVVVVVCLLLAQGTRSSAAEIRAPVVPEFSDKPAVGLKMRCRPEKKTCKVGDWVAFACTITNVSEEAKPVVWGNRYSSFVFNYGEQTLRGAGMGFNASFPQIKTPVSVRSLAPASFSDDGSGFVFGLPPGATLRFMLQVSPNGKATKPLHWRGRFVYAPKPDGGVGPLGAEGLLFSNVVELTVVEADEK